MLLNDPRINVNCIYKYTSLLELASRGGCAYVMKTLLANERVNRNSRNVENAISSTENVEIFKLLAPLSTDKSNIERLLIKAAIKGDLEMLDYLLNNYDFSIEKLSDSVGFSAGGGKIDTLERLLQNPDIVIQCQYIDGSIVSRRLNIFKLLLSHPGSNHCLLRLYDSLDFLIKNGNSEFADVLLNHPLIKTTYLS